MLLDGLEPRTDEDGGLPADWAQSELYGGPLLGERLVDATARISLFSGRGNSLLHHGILRDEPRIGELLSIAGLPTTARYRPARTTSTDPVRDGYLSCLHLRFEARPTGSVVEPLPVAYEFVARERTRWDGVAVEPYLRRLYGDLPASLLSDRRFHHIDYPNFDSGSMAVGIGVLVQGDAIWVWSRVVCHHK